MMAVRFQDYYKTLGVDKTATAAEIKAAYRKMARQFHPDVNKNPGAEAKLKSLNEAYEVLRDADKRKRYDQLGENWDKPGFQQPGGAGGFNFGGGPQGGFRGSTRGGRFAGGDFSEFFKQFFGEQGGFEEQGFDTAQTRRTAEATRAQADQEAEIEISLEDAYLGATRNIEMETLTPQPDGGVSRSRKSYEVRIPRGVTEGSRIRLAGQGNATFGRRSGDLYLKIHIRPHPVFSVDGHNLRATVDISPWEAALGAEISTPTIDGSVKVRIPPGAQSNQALRIREKGLPRQGNKPNGDLLIRLRIVVPKSLSSREEKLFQQLAKESSFKPRGD
jgi:curved DNA-binding protein